MKRILVLFILSLAACGSLPPPNGPMPAYTQIQAGSRLHINQAITIPPSRVSVFFQHGKQMEWKLVDQYLPYCKIELFTMQDKARLISPGEFKIIRVNTYREYVTHEMIKLAALEIQGAADATPAAVVYATEFFLHSAQQADVYRLSCAHWENPNDAFHLSIAQIGEALGELMTIPAQ